MEKTSKIAQKDLGLVWLVCSDVPRQDKTEKIPQCLVRERAAAHHASNDGKHSRCRASHASKMANVASAHRLQHHNQRPNTSPFFAKYDPTD